MRLLFFLLTSVSCLLTPAFSQQVGPSSIYPDATLTPGATDMRVTQANIKKTICVPNYTATVRPAVTVTNKIKAASMLAYGDTKPQAKLPMKGKALDTSKCVAHSSEPRCYELDHLISLEIGGCPDCVINLWPEPYNPVPGAHQKDQVENSFHRAVCSGTMTLADAQKQIVSDWYAHFKK